MSETGRAAEIRVLRRYEDELPPAFKIVPTIYPTSEPIDGLLARFWSVGETFDGVEVEVRPPDEPLALLEKLGPSPFERGQFPLVGFLATTYEKVSRYALSHGSAAKEEPVGEVGSAPET